MNRVKPALEKTKNNFKMSLPIMAGVLMMVSLINPVLGKFYSQIFTGNYFFDPLIGAIGGSISFGIPITAYVAGGELLESGVSLLAVTAFVLAWTTVGVAMLPLEIKFFGKRFAVWRNAINFVGSIMIAILTILTLSLI